jgi:hypothetical protein
VKLLPTSSIYRSDSHHPRGGAEGSAWLLSVGWAGKCWFRGGYSELGQVKEINQRGDGRGLSAAGAHLGQRAGGIAR